MMTQETFETKTAATNAKAPRPIAQAIDEVDRELKLRERCYERWVKEGRLSQTDATDRGERLQAALDWLRAFQELMMDHYATSK